jgi:uncharacterized protein YndB with AHSA1/START domain
MSAAQEADSATKPELIISRVFDAPLALVFKAWTQPDKAARWWGPQGFVTLSCAMDVRPGGALRISARSPEGTIHTKRGVYREVAEPNRLVFTYAWEDDQGVPGHEMLVTVSFAEHGTGTKLTLHQTMFESVEARDSHNLGWTSCMQRFANYLASA